MARTITQDSCVLNVLFTLFFLFAVGLVWGSMFSLSGSMHPVVGSCPRIFVQGKEKAPAVGWTQFWRMGPRDFHYPGSFWYGSSCLFQHQSGLAKFDQIYSAMSVILQMVLRLISWRITEELRGPIWILVVVWYIWLLLLWERRYTYICSSVACRRSPLTWFTAPAREKTVFLPVIFSVVFVLVYSL